VAVSREGQRLISATRFERWERRLSTAINDALAVAEAKALAAVRSMTAAGTPPDPFDEAGWDDTVEQVVRPAAQSIMDEVLRIALELIPDDLMAPAIDLAPHVNALVVQVRGIGADVAADLTSTLTEGSILGESVLDLEARVLGVFDTTEARAHTIARTSVVPAANGATDTAMGVIHNQVVALDKEWLATSDDRTRDAHADANGQRVGYDEPFEVDGEPMMYPGDPAGSAANVINCRCVVLYPEASTGDDEEG
jgi:uncharacterized protein with gpF-like domain